MELKSGLGIHTSHYHLPGGLLSVVKCAQETQSKVPTTIIFLCLPRSCPSLPDRGKPLRNEMNSQSQNVLIFVSLKLSLCF